MGKKRRRAISEGREALRFQRPQKKGIQGQPKVNQCLGAGKGQGRSQVGTACQCFCCPARRRPTGHSHLLLRTPVPLCPGQCSVNLCWGTPTHHAASPGPPQASMPCPRSFCPEPFRSPPPDTVPLEPQTSKTQLKSPCLPLSIPPPRPVCLPTQPGQEVGG